MIDFILAEKHEDAKNIATTIEKFQGFVVNICKDGSKGWVVWYRARREARQKQLMIALEREGLI